MRVPVTFFNSAGIEQVLCCARPKRLPASTSPGVARREAIHNWNFVSSFPDRIARAARDWRDRRFPRVPGETELTPLPEDRQFAAG
nr:hypothetical protein FJN17_07890 [Bradyrhizobium symbiodeficiens]